MNIRILKTGLKRISSMVVCYFLVVSSLNAQEIRVKVDNIVSDKVFLQAYNGSKLEVLGSFPVVNNEIRFENKNYEEGLYRLFLGDPADAELFKMEVPAFDFVISPGEISLHTSYFNPTLLMEVLISEDNKQYYSYLERSSIYRSKFGSLLGILDYYSTQDSFYPSLCSEIVRLQEDFREGLMSLSKDRENSFISDYLRFMIEPVYYPESGISIRDFMRSNFLAPIDFISPSLIHSPAISQKILAYLSFYTNRESTQIEQENLFIEALKNIMGKQDYDPEVHAYIIDYLVDGFEKLNMESVLVYIADHYLTEGCETDNEKLLQDRLSAYQEMSIGKQVKNIKLLDENDRAANLSDVKNEYVLIVFWASWCPHCKQLMNELSHWYKNKAEFYDLEVFAVSIDTSRADWEEEIFINDFSWINTNEPRGWEGKTQKDYNLYATPTLFLVNRNREIVAKPLSMREFRKSLGDLKRD